MFKCNSDGVTDFSLLVGISLETLDKKNIWPQAVTSWEKKNM